MTLDHVTRMTISQAAFEAHLLKMADSLSSGLGEGKEMEKEKEKEDGERDKKSAKFENDKAKDGFTETLKFSDKNGGSKSNKRSLSGRS